MRRGVPLAELPLEVMQSHASEIDASVFDSLGTKNAVAAFVSYGSTAPDQVRGQIDRWTRILSIASPE